MTDSSKKKTKVSLLVLGLLIAIGFNVWNVQNGLNHRYDDRKNALAMTIKNAQVNVQTTDDGTTKEVLGTYQGGTFDVHFISGNRTPVVKNGQLKLYRAGGNGWLPGYDYYTDRSLIPKNDSSVQLGLGLAASIVFYTIFAFGLTLIFRF